MLAVQSAIVVKATCSAVDSCYAFCHVRLSFSDLMLLVWHHEEHQHHKMLQQSCWFSGRFWETWLEAASESGQQPAVTYILAVCVEMILFAVDWHLLSGNWKSWISWSILFSSRRQIYTAWRHSVGHQQSVRRGNPRPLGWQTEMLLLWEDPRQIWSRWHHHKRR